MTLRTYHQWQQRYGQPYVPDEDEIVADDGERGEQPEGTMTRREYEQAISRAD